MVKFLKQLADKIPEGPAGMVVKAAIALVFAAWWTSAPGAEEASDFKANADPDRRSQYNRHYAFKGRGRKESMRSEAKDEVNELSPTLAFAKMQ